MKNWEIWMEGYAATEEHGPASKIGEYEAETFDDAVEMYLDKHPDSQKLYDKSNGKHRLWACRLYDNEQDARKSFG